MRQPAATKKTVFVGIPSLTSKLNATLAGFLGFVHNLGCSPEYPFSFCSQVLSQRSPVEYARNCLVRTFLQETSADYLWFLDDDVVPTDSSLNMLYVDSDIVSGRCFIWRKELEDRPQLFVSAFRSCPDNPSTFETIRAEHDGDAIKEIDTAGAACLLIKRKVLEDHRMHLDPRYMDARGEWANLDDERHDPGFAPAVFRSLAKPNGQIFRGEDIDFILRARQLGYSAKVHLGASFGHLKPVDLDDVAMLFADWMSRTSQETSRKHRPGEQPFAAG